MRNWIRHFFDIAMTVHRLRPHLRGGRRLFAAVIATAVVAAILEMAGIALLTHVLARLQPGNTTLSNSTSVLNRWVDPWLKPFSATQQMGILCSLVLSAMATKNAFLIFSNLLGIRLRVRMTLNLRSALFTSLQKAELSVFEQRKAGEIASVFHQETNRVALAMEYFTLIVQRLCLALFSLGLLVLYSWQLTLLGGLLALIIAAAVTGFQRHLKRAGTALGGAHQTFGGRLTEAFSGVRIVRTRNAEDVEMALFSSASSVLSTIEGHAARISSFIPPVAEMIGAAGAMIIVYVAYSQLISGGTLSPAFLLAFGLVISRLLPMLNQIVSMSGALFVYGEGFREVERWINLPKFPVRPFGTRQFTGVQREIRIEKVGFDYSAGATAIDSIDIVIPAGKTVALVGESGSGKSTLASLLLRLREPTRGCIRVDGIDYWDFSPESWHRQIGIVDQEAFLFNDTIRGNIIYGRTYVSEAELQRATRTAHLDDVLRTLPKGLDHSVGERGSALSGGQKQRLAIARAIVNNPQLLILDEATSALDNVSERMVQQALDEARQGRTVVVIAHRLSTIRNADHIVVLRAGRIVEQGSWNDLASSGGPFSELLHNDRTTMIGA